MTFPPQSWRGRTNYARMGAKERDDIEAALRADPTDIEGIAKRFERGCSTIVKLKGLAGIK